MRNAVFLLAGTDERRLAALVEALRVAGVRSRMAISLDARRAAAIGRGEDAALVERLLRNGLLSGAVTVTAFDAALEVALDAPARALDAVARLAARAGADADRSTVVVGDDHVLMEGAGSIELFFGLRRVAGTTRDEFHHWWLHELTAHTMSTPGKVGYRQVHADAALGAQLAAAAGVAFDDLDGVAVEIYPDLTAFFRAIDQGNRPDSATTVAERQMIDMSRARAVATLRD